MNISDNAPYPRTRIGRNNALEILYNLEKGYVYSEYALIPFTMDSVMVQTKSMKKIISDYEELKEWWEDEK